MIARMLVGSSARFDRRLSASDAASSSMKSGLPSAVSATAARSLRASTAEELLGELARSQLLGERVERERRVGREPAAPAGALAEKLRPGERDEEHGNLAHASRERLEQVEQARVGPVDVLVQEQHGPVAARATRRGRAPRRRAARDPAASAVLVESEERREMRGVLLGRGRPGELGDRGASFSAASAVVVAVEDAADLLDLLSERAVRAARAVRSRAAADDTRALCGDELCELERESATYRCPPGRTTVTKWLRPSSATRSQIPVRTASSRSRPIIGTGATGRSPIADGGPDGKPRLTGSSLPFATHRLRRPVLDGSARARCRSPRRRALPRPELRTEDAPRCSRRRPRRTPRRAPGRASRSTIASPVLTARRSCSPSCSAQSRTANAARTARSASSP